MTCKHKMLHIATREKYDWEENDVYVVNIEDTFECEMCGAIENVDVTDDWLCSNPY